MILTTFIYFVEEFSKMKDSDSVNTMGNGGMDVSNESLDNDASA